MKRYNKNVKLDLMEKLTIKTQAKPKLKKIPSTSERHKNEKKNIRRSLL